LTSLTAIKLPTAIIDQSIEDAFPAIDPGEKPFGSLVLVQIKRPPFRTKAGLHLTSNDQQTEYDNTKVAKVLALGPLAFHSRDTGLPWPEGKWFNVGDYVRLSQHNVKTWTVDLPGTRGIGIEERVVIGYIDELHVSGLVNNPLATKAFF
jgi:co-chaperonin GroES (HSP10)